MADIGERNSLAKSSCDFESNSLWNMSQKVYAECFKGTDHQVLVPMANVNPIRPEQPLSASDPSVDLYMQTKDAVPLIVASTDAKNIDDMLSNDPGRRPRQEPKRESGFYVNADGLLITSHHLIDDGRDKLAVVDQNMVRHEAKIVKEDKKNDLTLIKVSKVSSDEVFAALSLGFSANIRSGTEIKSIGHALGQLPVFLEPGTVSGTVIEKNIPYLNKQRTTPQTDAEREMLEIDALIAPRNSGGPWVALDADNKAAAVAINDFSNLQTGKAYAARMEAAKRLVAEFEAEKP